MTSTVNDHGVYAKPPVFISAETTERVLDWGLVISTLDAAYAVPQMPLANPARIVARGEGVWLRALASIPTGSRYMGTKAFGFSRQRSVNYLISLFDQDNGNVVGIVDGNHLTARRTAGTSAVAVNKLAPQGSITLGVLGTGAEARSHIEAIAQIRSLASVRIYSTTPERRTAFAQSVAADLKVDAVAVDRPEDAVRDASVVVAAARSHGEKPILYGEWLAPDVVVVSIGSTLPEQREADVSVVEACGLIVCDMLEEVVDGTGDMIAAKAAGVVFEHKMADLASLVGGQIPASRTSTGRRMFKSVGSAFQDIVVAGAALDRARELGLAQALPMAFKIKHA